MNRRNFLNAAGVSVALPALESLAATAPKVAGPRNFVAIGTYLGWHQNAFYPKEKGKAYTTPVTLKPLESYKEKFTIFSGLDHRAPNGHNNWANFLCGQTLKSYTCLLYTSPSPRDRTRSRMPSSA